jgi:hypothetical protein
MFLRDRGAVPRIGDAAACWVCPARRRPDGTRVAALRQVVNVEAVTSTRHPEPIGPVWWYWEGEGE